jgi:hypothetical protein
VAIQGCYSGDKVALQLCVCVSVSVCVCVCLSAVEKLRAAIQSESLCCYRSVTVVLR